MTLEDIEKLDEKPDIKRGLLNIKKKQGNDLSVAVAEHLADLMTAKHHPNFNRQTE